MQFPVSLPNDGLVDIVVQERVSNPHHGVCSQSEYNFVEYARRNAGCNRTWPYWSDLLAGIGMSYSSGLTKVVLTSKH